MIDIVSVGIHSAHQSPMEVAFYWGHLLSFAYIIICPSSQQHGVSSAMLLLYRRGAWHISDTWHINYLQGSDRAWIQIPSVSLSTLQTTHYLLSSNAPSPQLPSCLTQQNLTRFSVFDKSLAWCSSHRAPVKRSNANASGAVTASSAVATQFLHGRENSHQQSINKGSRVPAKCELKTQAAGQTWSLSGSFQT